MSDKDSSIRRATGEDLGEVLRILEATGLPADGVAEHLAAGFVVMEQRGQVIGTGGVEVYGEYGFLRSVAIVPQLQRAGLGRAIVDDRLDWSRAHGLSAVYLLTATDAVTAFFATLGFAEVDAGNVPEPVRASAEFHIQRCAGATAMVTRLSGG